MTYHIISVFNLKKTLQLYEETNTKYHVYVRKFIKYENLKYENMNYKNMKFFKQKKEFDRASFWF